MLQSVAGIVTKRLKESISSGMSKILRVIGTQSVTMGFLPNRDL
jgi:hypothetical protein